MVNNCVVKGCVVGTAKQNVTLREFPKASRQDASCGGAFRIDDSKRLGSRRVTPMCAVHISFLLTLLTMSNTIGFAKKRVINKTACCPNHVSIKTRGFATLTQSAAGRRGPARPSSRAGQRTAHASKQVFGNKNTGASALIWITTLNTYVICQTVRHDAHVYETSETMYGQSGKSQTRCRSSTESLLSESAIARPIVCCDPDLSTFLRYVDDVAGGSCM